jgi:murein DD-endopeptidase MepM/ murein hydrolase activator NlpD
MLVTTLKASVLVAVAAATLHAQSPRLTAIPPRPEPGSIVRLALDQVATRSDSVVAIRATMAGEPLHFLPATSTAWHALGAVPVDASDSLVAMVFLERLSGAVDTVGMKLKVPHEPTPAAAGGRGGGGAGSRLAVDRRFTRPLDSETEARIERENERARDVGRRSHESGPMWTLPFLRPRMSTITSRFGSGRVFNGRLASRHLGVDFRGRVGEPVQATNRGVVVIVDSFFLAGNVVYIDHGAGVITGYFHLSEQRVAVGDTVERGQEIGLVGSTGRVTGPHLHWAARYGTISVDPLDLTTLGDGWYAARAGSSRR